MISVFFNCSSPFVGYTLKKADYVQEAMFSCTPEDMTLTGYKVFNSSGSYMLLGTFDGRRYFHTRQSQSEQYDEQGRRIYTNIAFISESLTDASVVNVIAAYAFFEEEAFYKEIADMIILLKDGFTVNFEALSGFINRFSGSFRLDTKSSEAASFFHMISKSNNQYQIDFIVRESTWNYFVKQVQNDFNNSVARQFSHSEASSLASQGRFCFLAPEEEVPDRTNQSASGSEDGFSDRSFSDQADVPKDIVLPEDTNSSAQTEKEPDVNNAENDLQVIDPIEQKTVSLVNQILSVREKFAGNFWLGLVLGIMGTVIFVLIMNKLK